MATPFENFVNTELPKRIGTNESPITPQAGDIPVFTGVGLLTESKTAAEAGLATADDLSNKQETLVSGTNIKTINGSTLLGSGDLIIATSTNLTTTQTPTDVTVLSDTGTDATIALGNGTNAGVSLNNYTSDEKSKLEAITGTNTGDETQASIQTKLGVANTNTDGYLTSTDWNTFNNKQAALGDIITANTYGSSTQYPVVTVNAKGIVTGITLQTVPTPTFTDATFAVQKDGSPAIAATWSLSDFTASRVHTYPNKNINFGELANVATTDGNNLSGTRNRIVGGSGNGVSGTDNVVIGCSGNTRASGSGRAVIILANRFNTSAVDALAPHSIVLGTSVYNPVQQFDNYWFAGAVKVQTALCTAPATASGSANSLTSDGEPPSSTNCLPALLYANTFMSARHDFDIIITFGEDFVILPSRTFYAKRTVYVARRITSATPLNFTPVLEMSIATPQPDVTLGLGSNTVTINFTLDASANRLIPTVAVTTNPSYQRMQVSCRVDSHYNRK